MSRRLIGLLVAGLAPALLLWAAATSAQTITSSGPCPAGAMGFNPGALCFRTDTGGFSIWDGAAWRQLSIEGALVQQATPDALTLTPFTFTTLPPAVNGQLRFCSDCAVANPCAGGGTGALAKGLNGAWVCN